MTRHVDHKTSAPRSATGVPSARRLLLPALAVLAVVALSVSPASATTATDTSAETITGDYDRLTAAEMELLLSSAPKAIYVDVNSGDITEVQPTGPELTISPFAVYTNGCTGTRGCWQGNGPVPWYGFSTGVTSGTWSSRLNFTVAAGRYAKLCWRVPVVFPPGPGTEFCMPERNGDNATIYLGSPVTGTKVDYQTYR